MTEERPRDSVRNEWVGYAEHMNENTWSVPLCLLNDLTQQ